MINQTGIDNKEIEQIRSKYFQIREKLRQRIVGLEEVIEQILIAIFSNNHALLVGVPGLAKTLMIRSIAELLDLKFSRIQFTPDLMPSDITGTEVLVQDQEAKSRHFSFLKGPIFANIILADEINRTPPKTQAALLEAMEESTITASGEKMVLAPPFFVLATQNPIEQEGTYPLPAAQLDRFMFNILFDYPSEEQEHRIMRMTVSKGLENLSPLLSRQEILHFIQLSQQIYISPELIDYATKLSRRSRPSDPQTSEFIRQNVSWGTSPRAAQCLIRGAKARALINGRHFASAEDIRAIIHATFRHRLILNYKAQADGFTPDAIVDHLLGLVASPDGDFLPGQRKEYSQKLYLSGMQQ